MLDFSINLNNTQYLTDLEKSQLWKKISEISLDKKSYESEALSFEHLLLHFVAEWSRTLDYDHFGRPSIFTKLMQKISEKAPESLINELKKNEGIT